jgi:hypothetical protein
MNDDDYVTILARQGDKVSQELLKIEDATEKFKTAMHRKGILERILRSLPGKSIFWEGTKSDIKNIKPTNAEFIYVSLELTVGGHFASAFVSGDSVYIFDSMCSSCGPHNDYEFFEKIFKNMKPGYKMKLVSTNAFYQPSGGFCVDTKKNMNKLMIKTFGHNRNIDKVFHFQHFDTMSQHHFCYIEALVFLFHAAFKTPIGPKNNPDKRLEFIKKVGWGLLQMFGNRKSLKPGKFAEYMTIENTRVNKGITLPSKIPEKYIIKKIKLPGKHKNIPDLIRACI